MPALITSAPPPPSMMSLPEPVVMVLATDEAVTVRAVVKMPAFTLSKLAMPALSPVV